jgi:hypothetical protein
MRAKPPPLIPETADLDEPNPSTADLAAPPPEAPAVGAAHRPADEAPAVEAPHPAEPPPRPRLPERVEGSGRPPALPLPPAPTSAPDRAPEPSGDALAFLVGEDDSAPPPADDPAPPSAPAAAPARSAPRPAPQPRRPDDKGGSARVAAPPARPPLPPAPPRPARAAAGRPADDAPPLIDEEDISAPLSDESLVRPEAPRAAPDDGESAVAASKEPRLRPASALARRAEAEVAGRTEPAPTDAAATRPPDVRYADHPAAAPVEAEAAPEPVRISIGRVEVRAVVEPPPARPARRDAPPPLPLTGLADYLDRRAREGR